MGFMFSTAKMSVLVSPKQVHRRLSGTCECAGNPLPEGVPPLLPPAHTWQEACYHRSGCVGTGPRWCDLQ